ncbi:MAG TPA: bifunctional nuclease family protein [Candidatus Kapabacteria bacterium]|nr:bifunctional nuclease family protein [Candidatus Kapabacteria bacterium]
MDRVQVEILGISTSPSSNGAYALVLKEVDGDRRIPIIIGGFEAQAIALEMEGIQPPRPLTHDLVKSILEALSSTIVEASISELKDGVFFAMLKLADDQEIDARPSDAIAIAIRYSAPIYVAEDVMKEAAFIPEDDDTEGLDEGSADTEVRAEPKLPAATKRKLTKLEELQDELNAAIKAEDYEKAAKLRDELGRMKSGGGIN